MVETINILEKVLPKEENSMIKDGVNNIVKTITD
jgi:hypothetical protein